MTPEAEAVLMDAMLSAGWTPAQCRLAYAAAERGVKVGARSSASLASTALTRSSMAAMHRDLLLQRLGIEATKLATVTYDTGPSGETILEATLLVIPPWGASS